MGFHLSTMFAFVALTLVESYAASPLPPQVMYWNSVLPKTPMPKSISELVKPDFVTLTRKGDSLSSEMLDIADENILHYPYNYVKDSPLYQKILEGGQGGQRVFFLEEDIHTSNTMKYRLAGDCTSASFLSRRTADEIPFSLSKLQDILNKFSVKPGSPQADMIKETIGVCEYPAAARGEVLQCATSLEAMIDFVTSNLGRNVEAISTEVEKAGTIIQEYTIIPGVKKLAGNELIACHKMNYPPYAVFLCHGFKNLRAYRVPMEGADGTKAKALAVCHEDTSDWSPKHYAMRELKIKPGTHPVCHFLKDSHVVWIQTRSLHDDLNSTSGRRGT